MASAKWDHKVNSTTYQPILTCKVDEREIVYFTLEFVHDMSPEIRTDFEMFWFLIDVADVKIEDAALAASTWPSYLEYRRTLNESK